MTQLGKKAFNNAILHEAIAKACEEHNIKEAVLICTVVTCWNTVSDMLQHVIDLRKILNHVCDMMRFNGPTLMHLCRFILSQEEWLILEQCSKYLEVCCLMFAIFTALTRHPCRNSRATHSSSHIVANLWFLKCFQPSINSPASSSMGMTTNSFTQPSNWHAGTHLLC